MHPLRVLSTGGVGNRDDCPEDEFQVAEERGVPHVINVKFQSDRQNFFIVFLLIRELITIDVVPKAGLACQPARHGRGDRILSATSDLNLIHRRRSRPDNRHRPIKNIQKLRQFINLESPHDSSPPKDPVLLRTKRSLARATSHSHGTELPHLEPLIVLAHTICKIEQWSRIADLRQDNRNNPDR